MSSLVLIRPLAERDAEGFRTLRLTGLREAPSAFGSSYEAESSRTVDDFAKTIAVNHMAGAFLDGRLVGVGGFYRLTGEKMAHRGHIWGVYVDAAYRRRGIARRLLEDLLVHARQSVSQVHLAVAEGNDAALALYESLGFTIYGTEPRALRIGPHYFDEHLLVWRAD